MNLGIESEHTEFKKSTSELREGVVSIASILNKHGSGELYFGVTPQGDVCGQEVSEKTLRQVSQAIGTSIEPRIVPEVSVLDDGGKKYIKVSFSGNDAPYSCKGTYRIRTADEDVVMTASQVETMLAKRIAAKNPWDSRASRRSLADIDERTLRSYIDRGRAKERIPFEFSDAKDALSRLDLLTGDALTNAADVLFCESGDIRLKMGILETHSRTHILDLHQESGTVFELVDKGVAYIVNNTRRELVLSDRGPRDEVPEIPTLAVKEALMNAFAHQDWSLGGSVQVDIFNDAVEILSPGWFIDGQDPDEHLAGKSASSRSRNSLITKTLYRSGDIESYGTGIPRMKELCDEAGVRIEYQRTPDGTKLVFHRNDAFEPESARIRQNPPESARIRQNPPESAEEILSRMGRNDALVYDHVFKNGKATSASIAAELGIPGRTVRDALKRLVDAELVTSVGKGKSTEYKPTGCD